LPHFGLTINGFFINLKQIIMIILKGLIQYYRTNRKDFIYSCLFMTSLILFIVGGLTLASIMSN
jgi:hypothetical protein